MITPSPRRSSAVSQDPKGEPRARRRRPAVGHVRTGGCERAAGRGRLDATRGGGSWRAQLVWRFYPRGVSLLFMCILSVLAQVTTDCIMTVLTLIL